MKVQLDYINSFEIFSQSASVYSVKIFRKNPHAAVYTHRKHTHTHTGVGAQSTLGGHKIFARKICIKISKMPEFYMILAQKLSKYPNFYYICPKNLQNSLILHDFCPKMP